MKKLLFFLFFALTNVSVYGQGEISFEEKIIDVGEVNAKDSIKVDFKFKNIGNDSIKICSAQCSYFPLKCIYSKNSIAPGEEGTITVKGIMFNERQAPPYRIGSFKKALGVASTGKNSGNRLIIVGKVIAEERPKN